MHNSILLDDDQMLRRLAVVILTAAAILSLASVNVKLPKAANPLNMSAHLTNYQVDSYSLLSSDAPAIVFRDANYRLPIQLSDIHEPTSI